MITLQHMMPILKWLPRYNRADLRGDVTAGLTTAVMLIPQGMAYAMLAGLDPVVGLYASTVPLVVYALFGTSRQLAVGPVAMDSLLVASSVGAIAATGSDRYLELAILLMLMTGLIQVFMGFARLGFLTNFLSQPVISGFTSAAALIIGLSQLKTLLGVELARTQQVHVILEEAIRRADEIHVTTLTIGLLSVGLLMGLKKWRPMFPRALAVVVVGALAVWFGGLEQAGVSVVGAVPSGLPSPRVPTITLADVQTMLPAAVTIALVAFMEAISVGRAYATRNRYTLDANQELIGIGMANTAGAFFGAYPVTGGFSRTAVNGQAGARTPLAGMITAAAVAFSLVFLTPLFYFMPKAALAAIIMTAVFGLIDLKSVSWLWKIKRGDLALLTLTFVATLGIGIQQGILVGVGASLVWFIMRTTRPHTAVLGRIDGTRDYRNLKHFPDAITEDGVLVVRIDAQFYFGNVSFLKETLDRLERETSPAVHTIIIEASSVNQLDASADAALHEIVDDYQRRGVRLLMSHVKGPVRQVMRLSGFHKKLGCDHFFLNVHDAVTCALKAGPLPSHGEALSSSTDFSVDSGVIEAGVRPDPSFHPA